jgi:hypothetical protein
VGAPVTETFTLNVGPGTYIVDIDDLASQGGDGVVRIGSHVLLPERAPGETGPRHVQFSEELAGDETLELRLTGKPGSQLRVVIWRTGWLEIDEFMTHFPGQLVLDGSAQSYTAQVNNFIGELSNIEFRTRIRQGDVIRDAGSQLIECGGLPGYLPPGFCLTLRTAIASNTAAGTGTLVYGNATVVIEVVQLSISGVLVLDAMERPVELVSPPVVYSIVMIPERALVAVGQTMQASATVQASPGTSTVVLWFSSNISIASACANGVFTGVSAGNTQIWAVSQADPSQQDFSWLYVYNPLAPPPFDWTMTEPSTFVTVHRDDPNAGEVTLVATAVGPTAIFSPFSSMPEFWIREPGGPWRLLPGVLNVTVNDNGTNRTISYSKVWNPNATTAPFANPSTTPIEVIAVGLRSGIPYATTTSKQLTLVIP